MEGSQGRESDGPKGMHAMTLHSEIAAMTDWPTRAPRIVLPYEERERQERLDAAMDALFPTIAAARTLLKPGFHCTTCGGRYDEADRALESDNAPQVMDCLDHNTCAHCAEDAYECECVGCHNVTIGEEYRDEWGALICGDCNDEIARAEAHLESRYE
jgi:hypothetical protein